MDWGSIAQGVANGALSGVSAYLNADAAKKASKKDYKRAKEFAQNSIQWRVADAAAAGVSPLFALGAPTMSYSGSSVGVDPVASGLEAMGQNISRAALANTEPASKVDTALQALMIERGTLENDKLRAELMLLKQPGSPPGISLSPGGKADRLGGGGEWARDANGNAFPLPPGMSAQAFQDQFGDVLEEPYGMSRFGSSVTGYLSQGTPVDASWSSYLPTGSAAQAIIAWLEGAR